MAPAMTPGNRQAKACDPDVDGGRGAGRPEQQELLAVLGRVFGFEVGGDRHRDEAVGEPGIGEHRVGVRLDDIDGPRAGRSDASGARPRIWTIWVALS